MEIDKLDVATLTEEEQLALGLPERVHISRLGIDESVQFIDLQQRSLEQLRERKDELPGTIPDAMKAHVLDAIDPQLQMLQKRREVIESVAAQLLAYELEKHANGEL